MPMDVVASAKLEVQSVESNSKLVSKPREKGKASFESFFKKVNSSNCNKELKTAIKELNQEEKLELIQLLPMLDINIQQLALLSDTEKTDLLKQINNFLQEAGLPLLEDVTDIAGFKNTLTDILKYQAEFVTSNVAEKNQPDKQPANLPIVQVNSENTSNIQKIVVQDATKIDSSVKTQTNAELNLTLVKPELKVKSTEGKKTSEDKVTVKKDSSGQTDIKKLIDFEANKFTGKKTQLTSTVPTEIKSPEQQVVQVKDDDSPSISFVKSETVLTKTEQQQFIQNSVNTKPIEVKEVIDQIVKKAELLLTQKSSEIKIDLKPEFLGKMTIKIAVEEGIVTAKFLTDNYQVKNLLESNLNTLRQSLESQGIKVEKAEVNVGLNNGGMFDGSEHGRDSMWERPDYLSRANIKEQVEELSILNADEDLVESKTGVDPYHVQDDGSLSFLI